MIHAKTVIVDDWAIVGSANFNHRSLFNDLEVDVALADPRQVDALKRQFSQDLEHSKEVPRFDPKNESVLTRLLDSFAVKLRNWT